MYILLTFDKYLSLTEPFYFDQSKLITLYNDEDLQQMDIRLGNMSYYYSHEQKLIDDINEVQIMKCFQLKSLI